MPSAGPIRKLINWISCEEEDEEFDTMENSTPQPESTTPPKRQRGPLTLHTGQEGGMEIRHPRTLEDRTEVGQDLKQRRMVTLDLTKLPENDARYFLEFVYGVVFALDATVEKVTEGIFLLAPRGVAVRNDHEESAAPSTTYTPRANTGTSGQEELFWQGR